MIESEEPRPAVATAAPTKGLYFGWWIVAIAAVFHGLLGGLYHTGFSVYFLRLADDFKISYTKLSLLFAFRSLEGGLEGPIVGFLADRLGARLVIIVGTVMGSVGFILLATTQNYGMFMLVFLTLVTTGFSMPNSGLMVAINAWFRRRLGMAMSLSSSGAAIGGFLLTPVVAWIVLNHGWRWGALFTGLSVLLLGLPLAFMVRIPLAGEAAGDELPEQSSSGTPPGHASAETMGRSRSSDGAANPPVDFTISEALQTRTYWLLAAAIGLRLMAKSALEVHMVPLLVSRKVSEAVAASLVAVFSLLRLPGVIGAGFLADRWSRSRMVALCMVVGAIGSATMVWGPTGLGSGLLFIVLFAAAQASDTLSWALIGEYFGRKNFGSLRGGIALLQSLMSTIGPIAAGWMFDRTGDYDRFLSIVLVIYLVAAAAFWALRAPARPTRAGGGAPAGSAH